MAVPVADISAGFHTSGVSWRPDAITRFVDGHEVFGTTPPADVNVPMYMLLTLAVGDVSSWPGAADGTTAAVMRIDYVHAFRFTDLLQPAPVMPVERHMLILTGGAGGARLSAGVDDDRISVGCSHESLSGGHGANSFVFAKDDGQDVVLDVKPGIDKLVFDGIGCGKLATKLTASGLQVSYGAKDSALLVCITKPLAGDAVFTAMLLSGTAKEDSMDRSATTTPQQGLGGSGNDMIRGGSGCGWIDGEYGDDTLSGGAGRDDIVLGLHAGHEVVLDFVSGTDRIIL